jgi:AcrR family transcriptional regulator
MGRSPRRRPQRGPGRPAGVASGAGREALLRAARALMAERGLPRVTVREVAERAGVGPGLVHYYFGGKQELLRAVVGSVAGEMLERVRKAASAPGTTEERLRGLLRASVEALAADPYAPRLVVEQVLFGEDAVIDAFAERFAGPNLAAIQGLLAEGRAAGELREVEPMFLVPSMMGMCIFFFLAAPVVRRLFGLEAITPRLAREFADHAAELVLHGIAAARGTP